MRRRSYKFTDKRHARGGIAASAAGLVSLLLLVGSISLSYLQHGASGIYVGMAGGAAFLISIAGMVLGIRSYHEEERYYFFSGLGCFLNGVLLIAWVSILMLGM